MNMNKLIVMLSLDLIKYHTVKTLTLPKTNQILYLTNMKQKL
jgi:hypothetical protein